MPKSRARKQADGPKGPKRPRRTATEQDKRRSDLLADVPNDPTFRRPLPNKYNDLIAAHARIASAFWLFCRRAVPTTFQALKALLESNGAPELTERHLAQMAYVDPDAFHIRLLPEADSNASKLAVWLGIEEPAPSPDPASLGFEVMQTTVNALSDRFARLLRHRIKTEFPEYAAFLRTAEEVKSIPTAPDIPTVELPTMARQTTDDNEERSNDGSIVSRLKAAKFYEGQICHQHCIAEKEPVTAPIPEQLSRSAKDAIKRVLSKELIYIHQATAIECALDGNDVIVATPTASGKSLVFNSVVAHDISEDPNSTALYVFPTKALARDQLRVLVPLFGCDRANDERLLTQEQVAAFDGDVPHGKARAKIRERARVIVTNPDSIHMMLPERQQWHRFLSGLRCVVIDEAHAYRGVFGSHVALVVRRLLSVVQALAPVAPRVILCSATIGNPKEHAERLTGRTDVKVVKNDGSAKAGKNFCIWNPPPGQGRKEGSGARKSANTEAALIMAELVVAEVKTIAFAKVRKRVELLLKNSRRRLAGLGFPGHADLIESYRGGYAPSERRKIEKRLFNNELMAVAATSALELGVDIGELQASLHLGFPDSLNSLWQQAGRAGRRQSGESSVSILILMDTPLDQYWATCGAELFSKPSEAVSIDPNNSVLSRLHMLCAIQEGSLECGIVAGKQVNEMLEKAVTDGLVELHEHKQMRLTTKGKALTKFGLRTIDQEKYRLVLDRSDNVVLEEIEESKAWFHVHPGAVYHFRGTTYEVASVDLDEKVVRVKEMDDRLLYFTSTRDTKHLNVQRERGSKLLKGGIKAHLGSTDVTTTVFGYFRHHLLTGDIMESVDVSVPSFTVEDAAALWVSIPGGLIEWEGEELRGGIHAVEHLLYSLSPLVVTCDSGDISGFHQTNHPYAGQCCFIYETVAGGLGICRDIYNRLDDVIAASLRRVTECNCMTGCPGCIQIQSCWEYNETLHKDAARDILSKLLGVKKQE